MEYARIFAAVVTALGALGIAWIAGSDHMRINGQSRGLMIGSAFLILSALVIAGYQP